MCFEIGNSEMNCNFLNMINYDAKTFIHDSSVSVNN